MSSILLFSGGVGSWVGDIASWMSPGCEASTEVMALGCYWPIDSCLVGFSCGSFSSDGLLSQSENHSIAGIMWLTPADRNCAGRHTAREGLVRRRQVTRYSFCGGPAGCGQIGYRRLDPGRTAAQHSSGSRSWYVRASQMLLFPLGYSHSGSWFAHCSTPMRAIELNPAARRNARAVVLVFKMS